MLELTRPFGAPVRPYVSPLVTFGVAREPWQVRAYWQLRSEIFCGELALFADAEAIFRAAGGRPHWAKRHTLTREDVDRLYPMAERYRAARRAADPAGKFLNPHLEALFG